MTSEGISRWRVKTIVGNQQDRWKPVLAAGRGRGEALGGPRQARRQRTTPPSHAKHTHAAIERALGENCLRRDGPVVSQATLVGHRVRSSSRTFLLESKGGGQPMLWENNIPAPGQGGAVCLEGQVRRRQRMPPPRRPRRTKNNDGRSAIAGACFSIRGSSEKCLCFVF